MMRARGFTLIELLVVICVVAVTFGVALDRLFRYQELAERTAMEQNLAAINVALTMKFAALAASGRPAQIEKDVGSNPFQLLARLPQNYLGELYAPDIVELPKASWYFDLKSRELVYLPNRSRDLSQSPGSKAGALPFRIKLTEPSTDPNAPREIRQPYIDATMPFQWAVR